MTVREVVDSSYYDAEKCEVLHDMLESLNSIKLFEKIENRPSEGRKCKTGRRGLKRSVTMRIRVLQH